MKPETSRANSKHGLAAVLLAGALAASVVVKTFEGLSLVGYADVVSVPTDCYGNTHDAQVGKLRTLAECEALLNAELKLTARALSDCITREPTLAQARALISWAYNVGVKAACGSTLVRKLNAGVEFCSELSRWVYAGGKRWRGLESRRAKERAICEGRST